MQQATLRRFSKLGIDKKKILWYNIIVIPWGISAVGSASHWQCGGQGFKSPMLHH